ncbi:hypothetical protein WJX79_003427 [Trebouxia sp. C0005]
MSDTTASAPTPKEDAAAKQSEQMSTGSQTVDNHLKAGSHASQAQAASDKADHDKSVAETGAKPMKREAEPQI